MSFASPAAFVAQHLRPVKGRQPLLAFYGRLCLSAAKRLNAGDRNSGIFAWGALMLAVLVPVGLATLLASALHPVFVWLLDVAFLYGTLRFLATTGQLAAIEAALRDDAGGLHPRSGRAAGSEDAGVIAPRRARCARRTTAVRPLLWFLTWPARPGHPLALRAARTWEHPVDPEEGDFGWFAARAFHVIDWIPQRATAFVFAVAGNFEDAMLCWRTQAAQWIHPEEGIVLASGAGALGVRLGEPIPRASGLEDRPGLGSGEPAREDALASLEGLLWRALIVWTIVCLLAAALQLA